MKQEKQKKNERRHSPYLAQRAAAGALTLALGISTLGYTGYQECVQVFAAEPQSVTVTASTLNVRTGAGTNYEKVVSNGNPAFLKQGETAQVLQEKDGWFQVSFQFQGEKVTGYVSGDYVTVSNQSTETEGSTMQPGTSDSSSTDSTKDTEQVTTIVEKLPLEVPGKVTADVLRVRKGAGTKYDQLMVGKEAVSLKKGDKVTITGRKAAGGEYWYKISFTYNKKKKTGYVSSDYVTLTAISGKNINVKGSITRALYPRTTTLASKKYIVTYNKKKMAVKPGKKCIITGEKTVKGVKWYQIKFYYGKKLLTGYVLAKYVDFRQTEVVTTVTTPGEENPGNQTGSNGTGSNGTDSGGSNTEPGENNGGTDLTFQVQPGSVTSGPIEVRVAAGYSSEVVKDSTTGSSHTLTNGQAVTVYDKTEVDGAAWYLVTYETSQGTGLGYVPAAFIQLGGTANLPGGSTGSALSDAEFEASMNAQGFPESYKPYLRTLHAAHPYWVFEAKQTGLDWNTVIENESGVGENLIENHKNLAWKSMEPGAYNWKTDTFVPYDGSTWVTASKEAVEYYMDPRNFLTENGIFQFELLSYQPTYQTEAGVESILSGTPMKGASYTYLDEQGKQQTTTYAKSFLEAALYSGVSPYHLASRSKQEVVTSSTSLSSSVSGKVSGYEGLYNFYNIGATHSTAAGGAIINALKYAKNGTPGKQYSSTLTFNDYIKIPWNNSYRSIVGGAAFIGYNYIQRGQNTVYLEKFNVTEQSTYSHQYMANVEGAASESTKTAAAYRQLADTPILFSIPVYQNMPMTACAAPADKKNPNNWLKTLAIDGYSLTPTFDPASEQAYGLIVGKDVAQVTLTATTASSKATVTGAGTIALNPGNNQVMLVVTAENGEVRVYVVNITRES